MKMYRQIKEMSSTDLWHLVCNFTSRHCEMVAWHDIKPYHRIYSAYETPMWVTRINVDAYDPYSHYMMDDGPCKIEALSLRGLRWEFREEQYARLTESGDYWANLIPLWAWGAIVFGPDGFAEEAHKHGLGDGGPIIPYAPPNAPQIVVPAAPSLRSRFRIFKRDDYRCQICGRTAQEGARLEVDHRIPRSKGGTNAPSNLWTLCFECNRGKAAHDL
jgi:hypothetical protein